MGMPLLRPQTTRNQATRSQRGWNDRPIAPTVVAVPAAPPVKSWWLDTEPEAFTALARTRRYGNLRPHE